MPVSLFSHLQYYFFWNFEYTLRFATVRLMCLIFACYKFSCADRIKLQLKNTGLSFCLTDTQLQVAAIFLVCEELAAILKSNAMLYTLKSLRNWTARQKGTLVIKEDQHGCSKVYFEHQVRNPVFNERLLMKWHLSHSVWLTSL